MQWLIQIEPTLAEGFNTAVDAAQPENVEELDSNAVGQVARAKEAAKIMAAGQAGNLLALLEGQDATITVQVKVAES